MNHRGRLRGQGIDCIGLVLCVLIHFGVAEASEDRQDYPLPPPPELLLNCMRASRLLEIKSSEAQPGDVVCFWMQHPEAVVHCGFRTDYGLVHVYGSAGKVVEHGFAGTVWEKRLAAAFRLPEVK